MIFEPIITIEQKIVEIYVTQSGLNGAFFDFDFTMDLDFDEVMSLFGNETQIFD